MGFIVAVQPNGSEFKRDGQVPWGPHEEVTSMGMTRRQTLTGGVLALFGWSNTIVVGKNSGCRMSRVPYTKEWCWLTL
jgi:hypothetical protein